MIEAGLEEEEPSILVIVIDADPTSWHHIHVTGERARAGDPSLPPSAKNLITFPHLLDTVLIFIDAYLLTHRANRVAVLATLPDRTVPNINSKSSSSNQITAKTPVAHGPAAAAAAATGAAAFLAASLADRVSQAVVEGLNRLLTSKEFEDAQDDRHNDSAGIASSAMEQETNGHSSSFSSSSSPSSLTSAPKQNEKKQNSTASKRRRHGSLISQALSKGLCYIQRTARETSLSSSSSSSSSPLAARMLVLQASPDVHGDYNAFMNCIFSSHRSSVPIDAAVLSLPSSLHPSSASSSQHRKDSSFLQQASYITGGIYIRPERPSALLQYFLHLFLPSHRLRQVLRLPKQESVDFRAACFCHRRAVEQAYVCSVCLSIFCAFTKECPTCGTPARPPKGGGGGGGGRGGGGGGGGGKMGRE
ncbi:general transcription factor iih [Nannochloropsis oceanica]